MSDPDSRTNAIVRQRLLNEDALKMRGYRLTFHFDQAGNDRRRAVEIVVPLANANLVLDHRGRRERTAKLVTFLSFERADRDSTSVVKDKIYSVTKFGFTAYYRVTRTPVEMAVVYILEDDFDPEPGFDPDPDDEGQLISPADKVSEADLDPLRQLVQASRVELVPKQSPSLAARELHSTEASQVVFGQSDIIWDRLPARPISSLAQPTFEEAAIDNEVWNYREALVDRLDRFSAVNRAVDLMIFKSTLRKNLIKSMKIKLTREAMLGSYRNNLSRRSDLSYVLWQSKLHFLVKLKP